MAYVRVITKDGRTLVLHQDEALPMIRRGEVTVPAFSRTGRRRVLREGDVLVDQERE